MRRGLRVARQPAFATGVIATATVGVLVLILVATLPGEHRDSAMSAAVAVGTLALALVAVMSLDYSRAQTAETARMAELSLAPMLRFQIADIEQQPRVDIVFSVECATGTAAFDVQLTMTEEVDRGRATDGGIVRSSSRLSAVTPGEPRLLTLETTSFTVPDGRDVRYTKDWYQVVAAFRGILGTTVAMTFDWAAGDAPIQPEGAPGFGDRWVLRKVRIEPTRGDPVEWDTPLL